MADTALPDLTELAATPASDDELYIVDKSDTTDGVAGTNKKITASNLRGGLLANVVEDTTPQLGGNLDVNGQSIVSASAGNIAITPDTTGSVIIDGLSHPQADGTSGQFLKTNGSGTLSFGDASSGAMARIAGSTYSTIQHMQDIFHSTGVSTGGTITDDGDGTITVAAGTGLIRATDSDVAQILWTDWSAESGANVALTDNDMNYIYVEYNAGSPQVVATTTVRTDDNTNVLLGTIYREGTTLHITETAKPQVGDHALRMINRLKAVAPYARESGGILSETGTRNIAVTAGTWWHGLTKFTTSSLDTSVSGTFRYFYRDGATGWTEVTAQTQIDNTQYDNNSGTLATLSNNKYGVHWVYLGQDSDYYVLYGQGDYTRSEAENADAPASNPPHFAESHAKLIGKIVILKSASTFTSVISAFDTFLNTSTAQDHGSLSGLTDDDHTQYSLLSSQAGAPSSTPTRVGNINIDTTNDKVYIATDTASSADWDLLANVIDDLADVDTDKSKTPADGDVLTFDGTDWNAETPAGGGGQTLYDAVLATSGGDYTDLSTAMAALTAGQTLFVRSGTYTETASFNETTENLTFIGENRETSILELSDSGGGTSSWSGAGMVFKNLTLQISDACRLDIGGADAVIENCNIILGASAPFSAFTFDGGNSKFVHNLCVGNNSAAYRTFTFGSAEQIVQGNVFDIANGSGNANLGVVYVKNSLCVFDSNAISVATSATANAPIYEGRNITNCMIRGSSSNSRGIYASSAGCIIANNRITSCKVGIYAPANDMVITGNYIETTAGSTSEAIDVIGTCVITGNYLKGHASATGVTLSTNGDNNVISGNVFNTWSVGVSVPAAGNSENVIIGNSFSTVTTDISDSGTNTLYQTATDSDRLNTT